MKAIINGYTAESLKTRGTPLTVVCTPDKDITAKNFRDLKATMPDRQVGLVMSGVKDFSDDVQVITLDSLHLLDPNDVGIIIVDEVHTAASDKRAEALLNFRKAARWGVSATPGGRFDGKDLVTEGLFGPVVYRRSYQEGVQDGALVPITVYWMECPEPHIKLDRYLKFTSRIGRYRHGVLKNNNRNTIIGQLLRDIPATKQILCIMQYLEQMDAIKSFCPPNVEIVHAETDADKLAQYPSLHAITPADRREIYRRMEAAEIKRVLSTHVYKQGVNFPHLEVVINAGGGGSDIVAKQIPGRESRKTAAKDRSFLIDFWHPWDQITTENNRRVAGPIHKDYQSREKAYSELGFEQVWIKDLAQLPLLLQG
jgi:superfamily II DNA or RNA helicase